MGRQNGLGAYDVVLWIGFGAGDRDDRLGVSMTMSALAQRRCSVLVSGSFDEFARPLVRVRPSEPVVDARLRVRPHRAQVEVLLAPRGGRNYPNLVDHKQNVEYDVERVLRVLEDQRFAHGPLYAQGRWVVVPLHLQVNPKQAGGT